MTAPQSSTRKIVNLLLFYLGVPLLLVGIICLLPFSFVKKGHFTRAAPPERSRTAVVEKQFDTYEDAKAFVADEKKHLRSKANSLAAAAFTRLLKNDLAPFWLGTPWHFNGVTQTPGEGAIACGYFVTTLLRDMGVPLNRVALAQCASSKLITTLTGNGFVKHYSNMSFDGFIAAVNSRGMGVTIAGLDFHTGLLVHDGHELWLLHSNYINRQGVIMEKASESAALRASKTRMCGHITDDPAFLRRWVGA